MEADAVVDDVGDVLVDTAEGSAEAWRDSDGVAGVGDVAARDWIKKVTLGACSREGASLTGQGSTDQIREPYGHLSGFP